MSEASLPNWRHRYGYSTEAINPSMTSLIITSSVKYQCLLREGLPVLAKAPAPPFPNLADQSRLGGDVVVIKVWSH